MPLANGNILQNMKLTGPGFLRDVLLTGHAGTSTLGWRRAEEHVPWPGVLRDPDAAPWGAPGWVSSLPEQPPKPALKPSKISTTHLLPGCIPQVQEEPWADPRQPLGIWRSRWDVPALGCPRAGMSLRWAAAQCGADRTLSSPAGVGHHGAQQGLGVFSPPGPQVR